MNQSDWDNVVLQYLKEKGYAEAADAFIKQSGIVVDGGALGATANGNTSSGITVPRGKMALTHRLDVHKGVVGRLLSSFAADDPALYVEAYDKLAAWVDNSLDLYRAEVARVLYPVFIHTYLHLVFRDASALASSLLARYRRRLVDAAGRLSKHRAQELQDLAAIAMKQHLETHRFALAAQKSRTTIRLSSYSHDLLVHFMSSGPRLLPLLSILNAHVVLEVTDGLPVSAADEGEGADDALDTGNDQLDGEAIATNHLPVALGLLKDNVEDLYLEREAESKAAATAATSATTDGGATVDGETPAAEQPVVKKTKKMEAKEAAQRRRDEAAAAGKGPKKKAIVSTGDGDRIEALPFVPPLNEDLKDAWIEDIACRAKISPAGPLPSCAFFTFANTKGALNTVAFSRDASRVAGGFSDSSVRLYDIRRMAAQRTRTIQHAATAAATATAAGTTAGGAAPMEVDIVLDSDDEADDAGTRRLKGGRGGVLAEGPAVTYLHGHTAPVHAVTFTHDQRMLLSASGDGTVRLWSAGSVTGGLAAYRGHVVPVWDVAAGPHGYHFVSASHDKTARIWSTEKPYALRICTGHQADVDYVRWHPNCHYIATASSDRTARLWDVNSGTCVRYLSGLHASPTALALSPDGRTLACGADDGTITVWDLGSARRIATRHLHVGPVWSLSYSQGTGAFLASGGADESVRLWSTSAITSSTTVKSATPATVASTGSAGGGSTPSKSAAASGGATAMPATAMSAATGGSSSGSNIKQYAALKKYRTKSTVVQAVQFSARNLLLAAGPFSLRAAPVGAAGVAGTAAGIDMKRKL